MRREQTRIACIGGVDVDTKARVKAPAVRGTSNPVTATSCTGGVAGNVARNLARLGCEVELFSIVGEDSAGEGIRRELIELGIGTASLAASKEQPTASYTAVLEPGGQLYIGLANMEIFEELTPKWADGIAEQLARCGMWILDTNLPGATIERLLRVYRRNATVLADPISVAKSEKLQGLLDAVDVIFPNEKEAAVLSGRKAGTREEIEEAAREMVRRGARTVVVTLGAEGVYVADAKDGRFVGAVPPECVRDVTGAGDALVAGYALGLVTGEEEPVQAALSAASIALETEESVSTEMTRENLRERIENHRKRAGS